MDERGTSSIDVVLARGERHVERLRGLGPVGYQWTATVEGEQGIVSVTVSPADPPPGPPMAGAGRDELAEVTAVGVGEAVVRLRQVRPWMPDEPLAERVLNVKVHDAD
jgi:hypothetical protein